MRCTSWAQEPLRTSDAQMQLTSSVAQLRSKRPSGRPSLPSRIHPLSITAETSEPGRCPLWRGGAGVDLFNDGYSSIPNRTAENRHRAYSAIATSLSAYRVPRCLNLRAWTAHDRDLSRTSRTFRSVGFKYYAIGKIYFIRVKTKSSKKLATRVGRSRRPGGWAHDRVGRRGWTLEAAC